MKGEITHYKILQLLNKRNKHFIICYQRIVNGFVNIKEESDKNDTDEEEDDLSDVILIHLTYDQVQDIMDDIDNWSCIGNPYY